jgi:hypothetical protein
MKKTPQLLDATNVLTRRLEQEVTLHRLVDAHSSGYLSHRI